MHWDESEEVLLWILLVGAAATLKDDSTHEWYLRHLACLLRRYQGKSFFGYDVTNNQGLKDFLRRFPFTEELEMPRMWQIIKAITV